MRTSLAFVVAGLAAATVRPDVRHPRLLTLAAVLGCVVGAASAIVAYQRWYVIERDMFDGRQLPRPVAALPLVAAIVVCAAAAVIAVIVGVT